MLNIFSKILDLILPEPKSVLDIKNVSTEQFLQFYDQGTFANCITLTKYQFPLVKAAITANKFHNHKPAARLLAATLTKYITSLPTKKTILVPIPLSHEREKSRGYNQLTRIVDYCRKGDLILVKKLLTKTRDTLPQTKLSRQQRLKNLIGAFSYKDSDFKFSGCRVILVDDVITTGATMKSAYLTLRPKLPKDCELICVALAH
ncbi:MAG: ComF family protein [Candidatus Nomurabacteria bacterium]|nr:MAG: ComF family protein [Candidatus Nomurabacteria bacterium]